jgi:hypothetical protein
MVMGRTYKRDSNGRFAGGGGSGGGKGGGGSRPSAKPVQRSANRITRDNSGKITSVGGQGATARGGRLKTASGNQRAAQTAKVSGGKAKGTISKKRQGMSDSDKQSMQMAKALRSGKPNPAVDAVRRRQAAAAATPKPVARTSKAPANAAKARYKKAAGAARAQNSDLGGASASSRRAANTAAAKVRSMERNRSTASPKAAADSPRSRQQNRQIGRIKRAQANQAQAMKNESAGPNSKMSRKASVAKRAQQIYSGKINPKEKTKARLTKTNNPEALRKRVAKIKDNTKKKR